MDDYTIDQGTVIYGIRSSKYPTVCCYGVIISARCDIAQGKVPKYYFLVAVDASEWFCTEHGYDMVYSSVIKGIKSEIDSKADELDLCGDVLVSAEIQDLEAILSAKREEYSGNSKQIKKVDTLANKIAEFRIFSIRDMDDSQRSIAVGRQPKTAIKELENIYKGTQHHYYYLPQHAYLDNSVYNKGLIVDLLEIKELSLEDADRIKSPGIDFQILPSFPTPEKMLEVIKGGDPREIEKMLDGIQEITRLTTEYWLKKDSDFVDFEGTIQSPWCEHLMQRFSHAFIRIGLSDPTKRDFEDVITKCYSEVAT